jgi:hypothetical protein
MFELLKKNFKPLYKFLFKKKSKYSKNNNKYSVYQNFVFTFITYGCYIAFFLSYFIKSPTSVTLINNIRYIVSIYAGLFLMYRFNMFRTVKFNDFDRKIAFHSGVFIVYANLLSLYVFPYMAKNTTLGKFIKQQYPDFFL